jgi:beta-xylosidase
MVRKNITQDASARPHSLQLDAAAGSGMPMGRLAAVANIGAAANGLLANVQTQLRIMRTERGFGSVRFNNFFPDDFSAIDNPAYGLLFNTALLDFLHAEGLSPHVVLPLPRLMESAAFIDRIAAVLEHFLHRFGPSCLRGWSFEFTIGDSGNEVETCYREAVRFMRTRYADIRCGFHVGDIFSCAYLARIEPLRLLWKELRWRPDFVACSADPGLAGNGSSSGTGHSHREALLRLKQALAGPGEEAPPLFLAEWNTLAGLGYVLSGTFYRSAIIMETLLDLQEHAWATGFSVSSYRLDTADHDRVLSSLSLFLTGTLKRPVFFVLGMLARLRGEILARGEGHLFVRDGERLCLLLYNACYLNPQHSMDQNSMNAYEKRMEVTLRGMVPGCYYLKELTVDKDQSGIFNTWLATGGLQKVDRETEAYLQQALMPGFTLRKVAIHKDLILSAPLSMNACKLFLLTPYRQGAQGCG